MHTFGVWEVKRSPQRKPRRGGENVQAPHRQWPRPAIRCLPLRHHNDEHNGVIQGPAVFDSLSLDAYTFVSVVPSSNIEPFVNI